MENGFGGSHMDGNAITSDSELSSHDGTALIPHGTGAYHRPTSVRMSRRYSDSPPPTFPQQGKQSHSPRSTEGLSGIWANIGQICKIRALSGDQWRAVPFVFLITVAVLVVIIIKWKAVRLNYTLHDLDCIEELSPHFPFAAIPHISPLLFSSPLLLSIPLYVILSLLSHSCHY